MASPPTTHPTLQSVSHLLPEGESVGIFNPPAQHLFLTNVSILFKNSAYPLENLRLLRAKAPGSAFALAAPTMVVKGRVVEKEKPKAWWYAAIVALDPNEEVGFKVLLKGDPFSGDAGFCLQEAVRGLRDTVEREIHERIQLALKAEPALDSDQEPFESSAGVAVGQSQSLPVDTKGSVSQPPPYMAS